MLIVKNLEKRFGEQIALTNINVSFEKGKTTAIIGPSGSGKTTLLRCLNLLEIANKGEITFDDQVIDFSNHKALKAKETLAFCQKSAMVFQSFNLFPNLTVLENITIGLTNVQKKSKMDAKIIAEELLEKVGLADRVDNYPHQLSGGQQQRVAIARAVALQPEFILFDEPTSALDPELVGEVLAVMRDLSKSGMTMIVVTHEMKFAEECADHVVFMDKGEIVEQGSSDAIFHQSNNPRFKQFLNRMN
ncbi:MAG: ectoine/hydroxyectoine transporter ATP-binding protein EhuA [Bacillales bacterium]|jgi:cystine transport system ATP-binding protein|nr:ectoine/hydroxyectoine transporter ATP-binding protein EhuA [Bacillales bacterium]